jgi:hypothetical protein
VLLLVLVLVVVLGDVLADGKLVVMVMVMVMKVRDCSYLEGRGSLINRNKRMLLTIASTSSREIRVYEY